MRKNKGMNEIKMKQKNKIGCGWVIIIIVEIIFIVTAFLSVLSFINYSNEQRNANLCKNLNGTPFIYALDQSSYLCKLENGKILNLDNGEIFRLDNE